MYIDLVYRPPSMCIINILQNLTFGHRVWVWVTGFGFGFRFGFKCRFRFRLRFGFGFRFQGLCFRVCVSGFRFQGLGFRVWVSGDRVEELHSFSEGASASHSLGGVPSSLVRYNAILSGVYFGLLYPQYVP